MLQHEAHCQLHCSKCAPVTSGTGCEPGFVHVDLRSLLFFQHRNHPISHLSRPVCCDLHGQLTILLSEGLLLQLPSVTSWLVALGWNQPCRLAAAKWGARYNQQNLPRLRASLLHQWNWHRVGEEGLFIILYETGKQRMRWGWRLFESRVVEKAGQQECFTRLCCILAVSHSRAPCPACRYHQSSPLHCQTSVGALGCGILCVAQGQGGGSGEGST